MSFFTEHPEVSAWLNIVLGGAVVSLIIYIWTTHREAEKREREEEDNRVNALSKAMAEAFFKMEEKLERAVRAMEAAVTSVGKSSAEKMEGIENRLDGRIDEVEKKQTAHCAMLASHAEQIKGTIRVCQERAAHCPVFNGSGCGPHFHARSDGTSGRHKRLNDEEPT